MNSNSFFEKCGLSLRLENGRLDGLGFSIQLALSLLRLREFLHASSSRLDEAVDEAVAQDVLILLGNDEVSEF